MNLDFDMIQKYHSVIVPKRKRFQYTEKANSILDLAHHLFIPYNNTIDYTNNKSLICFKTDIITQKICISNQFSPLKN